MSEKLTEEWLKGAGFKWHQFDRQPDKHWLLWLGHAVANGHMVSYEDLGVEVAPMAYKNRNGEQLGGDEWFCWLRSDGAGRYHRFIHIRHLSTVDDLVKLIEGLTGLPWDPANVMYGSLRTPADAARIRADDERLDRKMLREGPAWLPHEKDQTRGKALPEHIDAFDKAATPKQETNDAG